MNQVVALMMMITARAQLLVDKFERVLGAFLLERGDHHHVRSRAVVEGGLALSRFDLSVVSDFLKCCFNYDEDKRGLFDKYKRFFLDGESDDSDLGKLISSLIEDPKDFDNENILKLCSHMDPSVVSVLKFFDCYRYIESDNESARNEKNKSILAMKRLIQRDTALSTDVLELITKQHIALALKMDKSIESLLLDKDHVNVMNRLVNFIRCVRESVAHYNNNAPDRDRAHPGKRGRPSSFDRSSPD